MVNTISKDDLSKLATESFPGRIITVHSIPEADKACAYLETFACIGFDTETRPAFAKGVSNKIALIQLSTIDTCFLFRINGIGLPDSLCALLSNPNVKKIGLSLRDDFASIRKRKPKIVPSNFIDLQVLIKKFGIDDQSLQRIYGILFGRRISKGQRLTNWEAEILSEPQKMYAALDAWACLKIYNHLLSLQDNK